jgi:molybdate transport system permease protein
LNHHKPPRFSWHPQAFWLFLGLGLLLVIFLALPLLALILRALRKDFFSFALMPAAIDALRLSLLTTLASVIISVLTGTPLAYALALWRFRGRTALELLIDLPIVLPPSVAGLGLLIAFGRQGLLGRYLTPLGISIPFTSLAVVLAQTFVSAPLYIRAARLGFEAVDHQLVESGVVEGATRWQIFSHIMLPLAGRALLSGTVLCWTRALGEFGATILFAGNLQGRTQTMPLAIYLGFESNLEMAVALSVVLILVSMLLLALIRRLDSRGM